MILLSGLSRSRLGDIPTCVASARKALELLPESSVLLRSSAQPNTALAFQISGDMRPESERDVLEAGQAAQVLDHSYITLRSLRLLGWYYALKGSLKQAAATYRQISEVMAGPRALANVFGSPGYFFGLGELLLSLFALLHFVLDAALQPSIHVV